MTASMLTLGHVSRAGNQALSQHGIPNADTAARAPTPDVTWTLLDEVVLDGRVVGGLDHDATTSGHRYRIGVRNQRNDDGDPR